MLAYDIRSNFLKFFENNNHKVVESDSVVPRNDPSLLFTNAGMVQFKNIFTGLETRDYNRATTSQKCIRAGGKHNDLDQVGYTARHHTFFEMLGNFSFGDYFKEDAINFAWTFLTKNLGISKDKLLVTVYHEDEEAKNIWSKVANGVTIIPISTSDNFWTMGDTGPCGPCSEIFFDHGDKIPGGMPGTPDEDGDRFMEIWNIVFMQFEQKEGGEKVPLLKKSIDTGMGLERIASVMQGAHDNYQTDLFKQIIEEIKNISKTNHEDTYPSYKVIADHIRSISFMIADGIVPSNEGRGYVLRRILRRAMRHGNMINVKEPFLHKLSNTLVDVMKSQYPELAKCANIVSSTIYDEEEKFLVTLDRGLKILRNDIKQISADRILDGALAFKLYDTYGFPLDLTQDILKSENITVDTDGFEKALQEQKNRAKWSGSGDKKNDAIWHKMKNKFSKTEFVGYEHEYQENCKVVGIIKDDSEIDNTSKNEQCFIVCDVTPFYAECGGQCGDTGIISNNDFVFEVCDTLKFCDTIIAHKGRLTYGSVKNGDVVSMSVNSKRRGRIRANHTATHLLQSALRHILGDHVAQRGSYINEERLRFDFSHNAQLTCEEIQKVEKFVNELITSNLSVSCKTMPKDLAISSGATALFGEKYSDEVRTVCVGEENISFELCGGTHANSTGEIGCFKILSEVGIGSGIRRIEAITGYNVIEYVNNLDRTLLRVSENLKCAYDDVVQKSSELVAELKRKNQEIVKNKVAIAVSQSRTIQKNNINILISEVCDFSIEDMRSLNDVLRKKFSEHVVFVINQSDSKVSLIVSISKEHQSRLHAGQILKIGIVALNGNGGGNALYAQGGGTNASAVQTALDDMINAIC